MRVLDIAKQLAPKLLPLVLPSDFASACGATYRKYRESMAGSCSNA